MSDIATNANIEVTAALEERIVSERYLQYMNHGFNCSSRNHSKAIGQFLTPAAVYEPMCGDILDGLRLSQLSRLSIIDPFCGDGRLVYSLLKAIADDLVLSEIVNEVQIELWDSDETILEQARVGLRGIENRLPFKLDACIKCKDAFFDNDMYMGIFDVCVTNPPWSSTKSLKPHAFESYEEYSAYQNLCNRYASLLVKNYPVAYSKKTFGAGTVNLSRFGLALSLGVINDAGMCAIVLPSSFFADKSSEQQRVQLMIEQSVRSVRYYPAEMKMFPDADQACVSLVVSRCVCEEPGTVKAYGTSDGAAYSIDESFMAYSAKNGFIIPLGYSASQMKVVEKISRNPLLETSSNVVLGREVDETRIAERLCECSDYRFIKGFMIDCYRLHDEPMWYYDPSNKIPETAGKKKVVWRDVSRVSQSKRIQATMLNEGCVAGNSLGIATSDDLDSLLAFLGVLNSRVFEFMAKTILVTNHVSAGTLKKLPYPELKSETKKHLSTKVQEMLMGGESLDLYNEIDLLVAKAFELEEEEYAVVLSSSPLPCTYIKES